jgi:hypothetical protein
MALHHVDMEGALRRLAERRIEDAMKEGKFDNLRGAGQPIELEDAPVDEDARATWWALRILRHNDFTPEEVRWRKQVDLLRDAIGHVLEESKLELLVARVNDVVHKINTLGTNAIRAGVAPLDLEYERAQLRARVLERGAS